jgi:hypothetical protein
VWFCANLVNLRSHSGVGRGNTQADQRVYAGLGVVTLGSKYLRTVTLPISRRVAVAILVLLGAVFQDRAEIWRARAKSLAVRPPAEWVLSVSVTWFQEIATSGWWLAVSAR